MPPRLRVARTTYEVPIRGGALSSEFRSGPGEAWDDSLRTSDGETTHAAMRENFRWFLDAVIPTAEEAGVYLACHPGEKPLRRRAPASRTHWRFLALALCGCRRPTPTTPPGSRAHHVDA